MEINLEISVNSKPEKVWEVLDNPYVFEDCFPGMKLEVREDIHYIYTSTEKKKAYIIDKIPNEYLSYKYKKRGSDYYIHSYFKLESVESFTILKVAGDNFKSDDDYKEILIGWQSLLVNIKKYVEKNKSRA